MPIVRDVTFFAIWFGLPVLVFLPRLKKPEDLGKRMVISVLAVWIALALQMELIHLPVAHAMAEARGNRSYDGVPVSGIVLFFGWFFGAIGTSLAVGGYLIIQHVGKKRQQREDERP